MLVLNVVTSDHPALGFFNYSINFWCKEPMATSGRACGCI